MTEKTYEDLQRENKMLRIALRQFYRFFRSGNDIPIERATIRRDQAEKIISGIDIRD